MEMLGALGMLMILLSCFYASLHAILGAGRTFVREAQAVYVLENVVERLGAEGTRDRDRAEAILDEELTASALAADEAVSASCSSNEQGTLLRVHRSEKRLLAEVCIPR
jgi:hypothetical protein